jgi:hypothetical protein
MARSGKYNPVHSSAIFGILIVLFLGILIFIFTVAPEVREDVLPPVVIEYKHTIFEVSPGVLEAGEVTEGLKKVSLSDIVIDNKPQYTELDVARDASFSSNSFTQEVYDFKFNVDLDQVSSMGLVFTVYELSGDGKVIIYLNGHKVVTRVAGLGDQVIIEFPKSYLTNGVNQVELTTASPNVRFWQFNSATILDLVLYTTEYDSGSATSNQVFSLASSEAVNAESATLKAFVVPKGDMGNIEIKLNGVRLMTATPPQNLELDVPTTALKSGANVLEWSAERDVNYEIRFAEMYIDTVKTTGRATTYFFKIPDTDTRKIRSGSYACTLVIEKDSGDESVIVELNAKQNIFDLVSTTIAIDVCDELVEGRNEIKFLAEDELDLKQATLIISNKEE